MLKTAFENLVIASITKEATNASSRLFLTISVILSLTNSICILVINGSDMKNSTMKIKESSMNRINPTRSGIGAMFLLEIRIFNNQTH